MSNIEFRVSIPLDDDHFLRRECPLCNREFKVLVPEEDIEDMISRRIKIFMIEENIDIQDEEEQKEDIELICPYCGQRSDINEWWTKEQLEYMYVFVHNYVADIANKTINNLENMSKNMNSGLISMRIEGQRMSKKEPWISSEINDMKFHELPCCNTHIKIIEDWDDSIYCHYCEFKYNSDT